MNDPDFFLASSDGYDLDGPRRCWRLKRVASDSRDDLLLIKVDPPILGQKYGLGDRDLDVLLIATRHAGASLFPINEWPIAVHVARLLGDKSVDSDRLRDEDFESIAWAELYRSESDALAIA